MGQTSAFDGGAGGPEPRGPSRRRAISAAGAAALGITTLRLPSASAAASPGGDGYTAGVMSTGDVTGVTGPGGFVLHTFTESGYIDVTTSLTISYLLVGGGGGGGGGGYDSPSNLTMAGGGGGGGQVLIGDPFSEPPGTVTLSSGRYLVTVGDGGGAGVPGFEVADEPPQAPTNGGDGQASTLETDAGTLTALGGRGGAAGELNNTNGGDGGDAGAGQSGGAGRFLSGGGGGGASDSGSGSPGTGILGVSIDEVGGDGGSGVVIFGGTFTTMEDLEVGGGGGGGGLDGGGSAYEGGGDGANGSLDVVAKGGTENRGGGGGGGCGDTSTTDPAPDAAAGGAGARGLVVIRYELDMEVGPL